MVLVCPFVIRTIDIFCQFFLVCGIICIFNFFVQILSQKHQLHLISQTKLEASKERHGKHWSYLP